MKLTLFMMKRRKFTRIYYSNKYSYLTDDNARLTEK